VNRKIDLYRVCRTDKGRIAYTEYLCSTNWARTCREAVARFHEINTSENRVPLHTEIKARFA